MRVSGSDSVAGQRRQPRACRGRRGEAQLVVVAAGEQAVERERALGARRRCGERRRARDQRPSSIVRADARRLEDVREIAGQAVGHVERGARDAAQPLAQRHARLRPLEARAAARPASRRRAPLAPAARRARAPRRPAGPTRSTSSPGCAPGARDRGAGRQLADDGHAQVARAARRVAADQRDAIARRRARRGRRAKAPEPALVVVGQRAGQQRPARRRAHRGHVRQVHRQRLVAERCRIHVRQEVPAFDQHVHRQRELHARRRRHHRRVVADADAHRRIAHGAMEVALDERELVHRAASRRAVIAARRRSRAASARGAAAVPRAARTSRDRRRASPRCAKRAASGRIVAAALAGMMRLRVRLASSCAVARQRPVVEALRLVGMRRSGDDRHAAQRRAGAFAGNRDVDREARELLRHELVRERHAHRHLAARHRRALRRARLRVAHDVRREALEVRERAILAVQDDQRGQDRVAGAARHRVGKLDLRAIAPRREDRTSTAARRRRAWRAAPDCCRSR